MIKNLLVNVGDSGDTCSIPGLGRSPGGGNGNPLQYSYLENSHGQRCLASYSPWGHKVSDAAKSTQHVRPPRVSVDHDPTIIAKIY